MALDIVPKYVQRRVQQSLIHLLLLFAFLTFAVGLYRGGVHLAELKVENIQIGELPSALFLSFLRMSASYFASLIFSYVLGLLAARTATGERIIIPLLDILQSVPVVGFFPAAISFFIGISNGHRLGIELAAVFLIFTSQAWNMAFAVYESAKTIPQDNFDAISSFGLKGSQKFWKLYAPAAIPRLVYNSILSWSNGWYFLVACEIIAVGPIQYNLPGIGSFLARAAEQDQIHLVFWGLLALTALILSLDYFIWRPVSIWSERFKQDFSSSETMLKHRKHLAITRGIRSHRATRLILIALQQMLGALTSPILWLFRKVLLPIFWDLPAALASSISREIYLQYALPALEKWNRLVRRIHWLNLSVMWILGAGLGIWVGSSLIQFLSPPWPEFVKEIPLAVLASTARLIVTLALSFAWVLPVILWSWNRPKVRQVLMTVAQVGASLPAIALFPLLIVVTVRKFGAGMELATIVLLITGMQWYILFNCLGGAAIIPSDLIEAARSLGLSKRQTWKHLVLPAIRPALITGALTAWGGGWNALVVSEYVTYKDQVLTVNGIGALLNRAVYQLGDNRSIMFCIGAMVGWILLINAFVWRPLYRSASERYKFDA